MSLEAGDFTIRPYQPGDEQAILDGFNFVFREVNGEGYVDRELDFWRWEFMENPHGYRIWVALTPDGVVAAHYGGVPYRMVTNLGELFFTHIVDSYSHPAYRRMRKPGLFVLTGQAWLEECKAKGDATSYGYPVVAAQRVGSRFLGYTPIRIVDYLCRPTALEPLGLPASVSAERVASPGADAEALFATMAAEKGCLAHRGAAYLKWRYAQIPGDDYEIWEIRRDGGLCGVVVLRPIHELVPGACTIADWLAAEGDDEACQAMLAVADTRAREVGRDRVMAVFPPDSAEAAALSRAGFLLEPSDQYLERRLNHIPMDHPEVSTEWLAAHWWYTLGDSDLV